MRDSARTATGWTTIGWTTGSAAAAGRTIARTAIGRTVAWPPATIAAWGTLGFFAHALGLLGCLHGGGGVPQLAADL